MQTHFRCTLSKVKCRLLYLTLILPLAFQFGNRSIPTLRTGNTCYNTSILQVMLIQVSL